MTTNIEAQKYPQDPDKIAELLKAIWNLNDEEREKVIRYIRSISPSRERKNKITFSWAGGLSEFRDEFTSLELEKKASEWRDQ
ncbi:MAG: hypothetical protein R6V83_00945 [Candidatus Thorarchaeota archaeon]